MRGTAKLSKSIIYTISKKLKFYSSSFINIFILCLGQAVKIFLKISLAFLVCFIILIKTRKQTNHKTNREISS